MWLENKSSQSELVLFSNDVLTVRNFNPMEPLKLGVNRVGGIKVTMPPVQSRRSFTAGFKLEVITYAEDVGELDVNWGKELHEHRPYAASIIPDRLPVGKRCVDGSPSLCHHQWIRESRDRRCSVARRRRTSTGCINRRPAVVTCRLFHSKVKVQTLRASIPMQTRDVLEHWTVMWLCVKIVNFTCVHKEQDFVNFMLFIYYYLLLLTDDAWK